MELKSVSSLVFFVDDVQKSVAFYESLGFRQNNSEDIQPRVYLNWFSIEFRQRTNANQTASAGQLTLIKVDDVDACYEAYKKLGYTPLSPPAKAESGSYEFTLADPDGYRLTFFTK